MTSPSRTLGKLLRHLIELLDSEVEQAHVDGQLDYRPRYSPILLSLMAIGPASIKDLAGHAGLTHSAASQTVGQMARVGLVCVQRGADLRQQVVSMTHKATAMIPILEGIWQVINRAADELDAELAFPLSQLVQDAISALERRSFADRIKAAGETIT